jgi:hypothetical protein
VKKYTHTCGWHFAPALTPFVFRVPVGFAKNRLKIKESNLFRPAKKKKWCSTHNYRCKTWTRSKTAGFILFLTQKMALHLNLGVLLPYVIKIIYIKLISNGCDLKYALISKNNQSWIWIDWRVRKWTWIHTCGSAEPTNHSKPKSDSGHPAFGLSGLRQVGEPWFRDLVDRSSLFHRLPVDRDNSPTLPYTFFPGDH